MTKRFFIVLLLIFAVGCGGKSSSVTEADRAAYAHAVQIMPDVTPDMQTAGYWIARAQDPDGVILTPQQISELNAQTAESRKLRTVSLYEQHTPASPIRETITVMYNFINTQTFYHTDGTLIKNTYMQTVWNNMNINNPKIADFQRVRFGVTVERADLRAVPSDKIFVRRGDKGYFDRLQMNTFEIGTPLAILWSTADRLWLFADNGVTMGWIKADTVAYCTAAALKKWESPDNFAVVTGRDASVYGDKELTQYKFRAAMGNRFPIPPFPPPKQGVTAIYYPTKNRLGQLATAVAYVDSREINAGYLPHTSRNLLNVAFSGLHTPYGWGGMFGEQDCSGYLLNMFKVFGIILPRNSSEQALVGESIYKKSETQFFSPREAVISLGIAGATTVQFPGHIMLYVGYADGEAYALHSTWSYRQFNSAKKDTYTLKIPARVVLSRMNFEDSDNMQNPTYSGNVENIRVLRTPD